MDDLKKCPFCSISQVEVVESEVNKNQYAVYCGACGSHTKEGEMEEVVNLWNKRSGSEKDCPICEKEVVLRSYKFNQKSKVSFFVYECSCGFSSGTSHHKDLVERTWKRRSS